MEEEGHLQHVLLKIHGRVQGVFFRAGTQKEAARLGLKGWVRNASDGSVEAVAEGERETLEKFIAWCHRGPPAAVVKKVDVTWGPALNLPAGFHIKY